MQKLTILKIGGNVVNHPEKLQATLTNFTKIEGAKILVHGGGKVAETLMPKLGIQPQMHEGRRITDESTLEVVTMVYAGLINKKIVAQLQALNCSAIGMSGADLNAIQTAKRPVKTIDFGFVGDIETVNDTMVSGLLNLGATPVFCAITHDKQGQLLNTNADTIAASLATALSAHYAVELIYCFEKKGVLYNPNNEDAIIHHIQPIDYQFLKQEKIITNGMIPKMDNAFDALKKGVKTVKICDLNGIHAATGTLITL